MAVLNRYEEYGKYRDNGTSTSKHENGTNKVIVLLVSFMYRYLGI